MFSLFGRPGRLCDRVTRRELLTIGGLSLIDFDLSGYLRHAQAAQLTGAPSGFGRAKSVLLVYLQGSPSHIDLWDPKPGAPAEIRGEFKPIQTTVPGLYLGEVLPMLAAQAKRFSLVRSMSVKPKGLRNHGSAIYMLMTGHDPSNFSPTGLAVPPSREDLPSLGAVAAKYRPAEKGQFSYAALCGPIREGSISGVGQSAGLLGGAYDPYQVYEDPTKPLKLDALKLPREIDSSRLLGRVKLRQSLACLGVQDAAALPPGGPVGQTPAGTFDAYYQQAISLVQSPVAIQAFQLEEERTALRERYGMTRFGQSCLLARRLIEAETRFVQVTWPSGSDTEPAPGPDGSWDTHRNNFPMLRDHRCPVFDRAMSALLEDLDARGLLESTLVIAVGEFGRSPRIGASTTNNVGPGGRDHWPECYSLLIAGGGVQPGKVYGESDRYAAFPTRDPVHPFDLICTIYHALGIDAGTEYLDRLRRPRRLTDFGAPIAGLF